MNADTIRAIIDLIKVARENPLSAASFCLAVVAGLGYLILKRPSAGKQRYKGRLVVFLVICLFAVVVIASAYLPADAVERLFPHRPYYHATDPQGNLYAMSSSIDPTCKDPLSNANPNGCQPQGNVSVNGQTYTYFRVWVSPGGQVLAVNCGQPRSVIDVKGIPVGGTGVCTGKFNGDTRIPVSVIYAVYREDAKGELFR